MEGITNNGKHASMMFRIEGINNTILFFIFIILNFNVLQEVL